MSSTAVWEVDLYVRGPITLQERYVNPQRKGSRFGDPFYSDVKICSIPSGLRATISAWAATEDIAHRAAHVFFGRMLDSLTLSVNQPMFLSPDRTGVAERDRSDVRRVVENAEIEDAFETAQKLASTRQSFLRSLGWYRKALYGEDPFDKFLAFWNSIETTATVYYKFAPDIDLERAHNGCKSQIWECFKALWGDVARWPLIAGDSNWIDDSYSTRVNIAHGVTTIDLNAVSDVVARLSIIEAVSHKFLYDWKARFLFTDARSEADLSST